jgi:hypothetical protein
MESEEGIPAIARWRKCALPCIGAQHRDANPNRLKAGWVKLEGDYLAFRKEEARLREKCAPSPPEWPVFVRSVEVEGLRFIALASDTALEVEGEAMSHCIAEYGPQCRTSMLRVYSVREKKTGVRVATLTVQEISLGRWISIIRPRERGSSVPHAGGLCRG